MATAAGGSGGGSAYGGAYGGGVLALAVRRPTVLPEAATLGDVRRFLAGEHVHLAVLTDAAGRLLTCIDRADLAAVRDRDDAASARDLGRLTGRTVPVGADADEVVALLVTRGVRRLAVVDEEGRLVGLVCRKRSGTGFCTDEGIAQRRSAVT